MRKLEDMEWWPELLATKDQFTLRELAERFDVQAVQISAAFNRNGIDREPWPRSRPSRREVQAARNPKPPTVADRLAPFADMIGRVPDDEIAGLSGLTPKQVAAYRRRTEAR